MKIQTLKHAQKPLTMCHRFPIDKNFKLKMNLFPKNVILMVLLTKITEGTQNNRGLCNLSGKTNVCLPDIKCSHKN